ncbi:MAG: hypothetical protein MZW92_64455 [Comamonadaceae bacterium]|nr:hypothetical protein [Comamonadaceae bacterium]
MTAFTTLKEMLVTGADGATAIAAPGVPGAHLCRAAQARCRHHRRATTRLGVGRNDRVGIVLAERPGDGHRLPGRRRRRAPPRR